MSISVPDLILLKVISGPSEGEELSGKGPILRVGRTKKSEICFKDPSVSEKHAMFEWSGSEWLLWDVGSSNGTIVNGVQLEENEAVALKSGDRIIFGTDSQVCSLQVRMIDSHFLR